MTNQKKQELAYELRHEGGKPRMADTSEMSKADASAEAQRFMQACMADARARGRYSRRRW